MFNKSIVAFLDILGFKAALAGDAETSLSNIYSVLATFAHHNANFKQEIIQHAPGHKTTISNPAVSSFSDHIVISQPIKTKADQNHHNIENSFMHVSHTIARISYHALTQGFLMRGAVTVGDMHHDKNIVFGQALVDVAEIEAKQAIYPRVIISEGLSQALTTLNPNYGAKEKRIDEVLGEQVITRDFDGLYYLNWIDNWKFKLDHSGRFNEAVFGEKLLPIKRIIEKNLSTLKICPEKQKYWYWMANYYNRSLAHLTTAHNSPPADQQFFPKIDLSKI